MTGSASLMRHPSLRLRREAAREILAQCFPGYQVWYVDRYQVGLLWCARLEADHQLVVHAATPGELAEAIIRTAGAQGRVMVLRYADCVVRVRVRRHPGEADCYEACIDGRDGASRCVIVRGTPRELLDALDEAPVPGGPGELP